MQQIRTKGSSRAESHMAAMRASSRSLLMGSTSNNPHQTIITKSTASRNSNMLCTPHLPAGRESKLPNAHTSAMSQQQQQQHGATSTGTTGNSSSSMHDMIASSSGTLAGYHAGRTATGTVNTGTVNGTAKFSRSATSSNGNNNNSSGNNKSSATLTVAGTDSGTQVTGGNSSTFVISTTGSTKTASTSSSPVCVLFLHIVAEVMQQSTYIDVTRQTSNSSATTVKSSQLFIPQPCPYVPETASSNDAITAAVYDSTSSNVNIDVNEGLKVAAQEPEFAVAARDVLAQLLRDAIACADVKQSISAARAAAVAAPYTPVFEDIVAGKQSILQRLATVLHIGTTMPTVSDFKQALCDSTLNTDAKNSDKIVTGSAAASAANANVYTALMQAVNDAEHSNSAVLQLHSVLTKLSRPVVVALDTWLNVQEHLQYITQREAAIATAKAGKSYGYNSSDTTATTATTTAATADSTSDVVDDSQQLQVDEVGASKAATAIQSAQRAKQARAQVAHKRHLASPRGKSETLAATALQSHARRMAAAKHTAQLQQSALAVGVKTAVQDPAVQCMVATALENTLFNLFEEALRGEFDVRAKPCRTVVKPATVVQQ
eukprot:17242-Heterococcus_DN1.PRE.2